MENPSNKGGFPHAGLDAERLDLLLRDLRGLPTFPCVIASLLERLEAISHPVDAAPDGGSMGELVGLISSDPPLAARVLAEARRLQPAGAATVPAAVMALQAEGLRTLALTTELLPDVNPAGIDYPALWKHSVAVGVAAEVLAGRLPDPLDGDEAACAGLLHELGRFVFVHAMPKSFRKAVEAADRRNASIAECEREIIGQDHAVVGRRLAQRWRLTAGLQDVIWLYGQPADAIPPSVSAPRMVAVVALADALARDQGFRFCPGGAADGHEALASRLGLSPEDLSEVAGGIAGRVEQRWRLLGMERADAPRAYHAAVSRTAVSLARAQEEARRHMQRLAGWERAFQGIEDFLASLSGESTLADVLERLADVVAAAQGGIATDDWPVVAYSLTADGRGLLVVRSDGTESPAWRDLSLEAPLPAEAPASTGDVLDRLVGQGDHLRDWVSPEAFRHRALCCGGRWIGGAFCPATDGESCESWDAIAMAVAPALALVRSRSGSMHVSEQLAGASRALMAAREALAQARALAAAGEIAAGAAHELNTPLAVISGRAQLMAGRATDEENRKTWDLISEQAQKISDVLSDLMTAVSPPAAQPSTFDAVALLREAGEEFSSIRDEAQDAAAQVDIQGEEGLPYCYADRGQIREALLELLSNAARAGSPEGRISLAAEMDEPRGVVLLTVEDFGVGMDPRAAERAFTPFFSAHRAGRRRGMGLPRVRRLVENNGGRVWLRSRAGQGTTVYIELPAGGS